MPAIHQDFNVKVHDSSIDRYTQKIAKASTATDAQTGACERLASSSEHMSRTVASSARLVEEMFRSGGAKQYMERLGIAVEKTAERDQRAAQVTKQSWLQRELAANKAYYAAQKVAKEEDKAAEKTNKLAQYARSAASAFLGFGRAVNPVEKLTDRLSRTVITLFSVRRVLRYITDATERAPDKIGASFTKMGTTVNDTFSRVVVNAMAGMQGGVDKLERTMNSTSGQRFFRGLDTAARLAGMAIGALLEGGAKLIDFLGNHATETFTVAAIAASYFAAQLLLTHSSALLAAAPMVLMVGLLSAVVVGMMKAGVTSDQIFTYIGKGAGALYALCYNIFVDLYNGGATLAEFFANVFDDPLGAASRLFLSFAQTVLGSMSKIAQGMDTLFGTNLAKTTQSALDRLSAWGNSLGSNKITINRMERISYSDTMEKWGAAAGDLGSKLANGGLDSLAAVQLKAINSDTSAIRKSVDSSKEDLKSLVDVAERQYINKINLTTQQPVITVNGQNTGNFKEDLQSLVDAITEILIDQTSSGATVATAMP